MANDAAWQQGWSEGAGIAQERRAHKQALSDEEFHQVNDELFKQRDAIQAKLPALKDNPDEYKQATDQLTTLNKAIRLHWHPDKNPGMLQKYGHVLTDRLNLTKPLPTQAQRDAAGNVKDVAETQRLAASAPLSAQQQSVLTAQANSAAQLAAIRGDMSNYVALNPTATNEDQTSHLNFLLQKYQGIAGKGSWAQIPGKINGQPVTLNYDKNTNIYTYQNGQPIPQEEMDTWVPDPKASAFGQKHADYLAFVAKNPEYEKNGGNEEKWAAAQAVIGRTGNQFNVDTKTGQIIDLASGTRYSDGDKDNPPEVQEMFKQKEVIEAKKEAQQEKLYALRGSSYNYTRPMNVLDTANGNAPTVATYEQMIKYPGRFIPAAEADKALAKENLMEDIMGNSQLTRKAVNDLAEDFPTDMKLKITAAMRADDPHAALDQLIGSMAVGSLTPDQQTFLIQTRQLAENAMSMRSILGAGQGSEDVRNAIRDTLPTLLSPDKQYALKQLDAFDATIARLRRGVPKVPLRTDIDTGGGANTPLDQKRGGNAKLKHSLKKAMTLPFNKGKTEAQVRADLESHGYEVIP